MIKRKKINITVSDTAPLYPPLWGGPKRVWGLYSGLGDPFSVTYVGINPADDNRHIDRKVDDNIREIINPLCRLYYPFRRFELKIIKNLTFDIFTYIFMWLDKGFKREINRHEADILVASHPWSSPCFKIKKGQVFIYDSHNCEYLLMKQILKGRWYGWIISFFVRLIEMRACRKADVIIATSEKDKESFVRLYNVPEDKIFILPNGTYVKELGSGEEKTKVREKLGLDDKALLLFIGAYYNPNIDAAKFLVHRLASELEDVNIAIVGTVSDYFRDKRVPDNVKLIGRVDDDELFEWLRAADLGLNPMFSGSGINMKMLDYFSFGLPVIATWTGARGIDGVDSVDFIACHEGEFLDNIRFLLRDTERRVKMGKNARLIAEKSYDWSNISNKLGDILENLYDRGKRPLSYSRNDSLRCTKGIL